MKHNEYGIPDISLRQLKAMLQVWRLGSVTRAASALNRSQTAVTKAVNDLEHRLGVALFERTATGMIPTRRGDALARRVALCETEFATAGAALARPAATEGRMANNPVFTMELSHKRFAAFIALHETRDVAAAADTLSVTRTAVYNSIRQLEELLGIPLFERNHGGFTPTAYSNLLVRHIKLGFAQLRHGLDEIASRGGVILGSVAIGTLPYSRTTLTPRAIIHLLDRHPRLDVSTREGPYPMLESSLRNGDLDFIIGAIRTGQHGGDLKTEVLFHDRLSLIVRKGHPLEHSSGVQLDDLHQWSWVLPPRDTPSRQLFDEILAGHGLQPPRHAVETSSLSTLRGLLLESDRIALLSEHQIHYEQLYGLLATLPMAELANSHRPIGVTMRSHTSLSPAAQRFLDSLRAVARQLTG